MKLRFCALLRRATEELRLQPPVLFLEQLDPLFARNQSGCNRIGVRVRLRQWLHGRKLYRTARAVA
jgi:hypothetical protein